MIFLAATTSSVYCNIVRTIFLLLISSMAGFCAESCELVVETVTGKGTNDGTDAGVYVRINDLENKHPLDTPGKNDRQAGAEDSYPGILIDIEPEKIESVTIEIDGEDAWFLKSISLRVVCGDRSSEELVFNKRDWMSTAKESVYSRSSIKLQVDGKLVLN